MPQMNKGGQFVFGLSLIQGGGTVQLPAQAIAEYGIAAEGRVYLFTGSKVTGGFCVTHKGLLAPSMLGHILTENPALQEYHTPEGEFVRYKGRFYCWLRISAGGARHFRPDALAFLGLAPGMRLLSIRSSDIAFTMGAKGPLLERAARYPGRLPLF